MISADSDFRQLFAQHVAVGDDDDDDDDEYMIKVEGFFYIC